MKRHSRQRRILLSLIALSMVLVASVYARGPNPDRAESPATECDGTGPADGSGVGNGPGAGNGPGDGSGTGDGTGSGNGPGNGYGVGDGSGVGDGPRDGSGHGPGDGDCTSDTLPVDDPGSDDPVGGNLETSEAISRQPMGQGPPIIEEVIECSSGTVQLRWRNDHGRADRVQACVYDIYGGRWVEQDGEGGIWCELDPSATTGSLRLRNTGAYFAWVGNQYGDGQQHMSATPTLFVNIDGAPHRPVDVEALQVGPGEIRLQWRPEVYGTLFHWMIAYHAQTGQWVEMEGPRGPGTWHYTAFGDTEFGAGAARYRVPFDGDYALFMIPVAWDGRTQGRAAAATVSVQ